MEEENRRLREKVALLEQQLHQVKEKNRQENEKEMAKLTAELNEKKLTNLEILRYGRQLIVPEIGVEGQLKLKNTKVLIVGAGGLGCPAALYLASSGIGKIGLVDYDEVELGNLHRQVLHPESRIGVSKALSAKIALEELNSSVECQAYQILLDSSNALDLIKQYDIIVDATDNVATRYLLNDACVLSNKVLVSGSALRLEGQLTVYNYKNGPCYRCLFPVPPPSTSVTNCSDSGVLPSVPGIIGLIQALEVIKIAVGIDPSYVQKLLLFDASSGNFRVIKLRPRSKDCIINGDNPTLRELIDYQQFCGSGAHDKTVAQKILKPEERITCEDYKTMTDKKEPHYLLDVREKGHFQICSLPNSINIPLKELPKRIEEISQIKEPIVVVCKQGNDSQIAVDILRKALPEIQAKDLTGGLVRWSLAVDSNFPMY